MQIYHSVIKLSPPFNVKFLSLFHKTVSQQQWTRPTGFQSNVQTSWLSLVFIGHLVMGHCKHLCTNSQVRKSQISACNIFTPLCNQEFQQDCIRHFWSVFLEGFYLKYSFTSLSQKCCQCCFVFVIYSVSGCVSERGTACWRRPRYSTKPGSTTSSRSLVSAMSLVSSA